MRASFVVLLLCFSFGLMTIVVSRAFEPEPKDQIAQVANVKKVLDEDEFQAAGVNTQLNVTPDDVDSFKKITQGQPQTLKAQSVEPPPEPSEARQRREQREAVITAISQWTGTIGLVVLCLGIWTATASLSVSRGYGIGPGFFLGLWPVAVLAFVGVWWFPLVLTPWCWFAIRVLPSRREIPIARPGWGVTEATDELAGDFAGLQAASRETAVSTSLALGGPRRESRHRDASTRRRPIQPWFDTMVWLPVALFTCGMIAILRADCLYTNSEAIGSVLTSVAIRQALWLSIWTTLLTTFIGLTFSIPMGYALSRYRFIGHAVIDSLVDLPILLPPLIVGLSLLIFFQTPPGKWIETIGLSVVFHPRGIVLCQLFVSISFGIRAMKLTFDGIDIRMEHVAMTLGCSRLGSFFRVALPLAWRGIVTSAILIWTRALGIFGPLMILVGAARGRTEVLPTTIYLEQSVGNIDTAVAVAVVMVAVAAVALITIRFVGLGER